jgi:hypothetical protein
MDSINHCIVTREDLRFQLEAERLLSRVAIPADGEQIRRVALRYADA